MKYIMLQSRVGEIKRKIPIIFPDILVHSQVTAVMKVLLEEMNNKDVEIISAGTILMRVDDVYGKSTTLKLEVDKGDVDIINTHDYLHGIV